MKMNVLGVESQGKSHLQDAAFFTDNKNLALGQLDGAYGAGVSLVLMLWKNGREPTGE